MSTLPAHNRLLEQLPRKTFKSVRSACELIELKSGDVLSQPGERIRDVYFPTQSVVSLVATVAGSATLKVALVGQEGMLGLPLLLGADAEPLLARGQRSGEAWRMKAEPFQRMTEKNKALLHALNKYALVRLAQLAQNTACVKAHATEARLARRLLMMLDRSHWDQFHATQASLASMLGVQRPTVTMLAVSFQRKHIIRYNRGTLTILDRKALEALSCECYWVARQGAISDRPHLSASTRRGKGCHREQHTDCDAEVLRSKYFVR